MKEYKVRIKEFEDDDYLNIHKEMTTGEVIHTLEYIKRGYIPDYNFTGTESDFENCKMHTAMSKAIEVLKSTMK